MVTKEIIEQSISNGTLNPKMLDQFMNDMKIRSFSYDYQIQKDLVNFHEHRFFINPAKWDMCTAWKGIKERSYTVTVKNCQMLFTGTKDKYLRSSLYNKYLSPEEITKNMKFFRNSLIVFANGYICRDYRVKVFVDKVEFTFRYKELNKLAHIGENSVIKLDGIVTDIRIMMFPNAINTISGELKAEYFSGNNLVATPFPSEAIAKMKEEYNYFGYWINNANGHHYMVTGITWTNNGKFFTLPDPPPIDVTKYSLMIVGMDLIYQTITLNSNTEWITFTNEKMPLPKDDIAVFIHDDEFEGYIPADLFEPQSTFLKAGNVEIPEEDFLVLDEEGEEIEFLDTLGNTVSFTEFYPNVYRVSNPNGYMLKLMAFYDMKNHNNHIFYDNEIAPLMKILDLKDLYEDGRVPKVLEEFKPVQWDYGFQDMFKDLPYEQVDLNTTWDAFLYKMNELAGMLKKWMLFYEEFQRRTYSFLPGWYHNMSKYSNLNNKVRINTLPEVPDTDLYRDFSVPQYMFSYKNTDITGNLKSFNWFIDGRYTIPTYAVAYHGYQYVYFPTSKINPNSIIEVERFDGTKFNKDIVYTEMIFDGTDLKNSEDYQFVTETNEVIEMDDIAVEPIKFVEIKMNTLIKQSIVANSLFFVDSEGNYVTDRLKLSVVDKVLGEVEFDPKISVLEILPEHLLRIYPRDEEIFSKEVKMYCRNGVVKFNARSSGVDWIRYNANMINLNSPKDIHNVNENYGSRIRIYTVDGRLIPKIAYRVFKQKNFNDLPVFNLPVDPNVDLPVQVEYIGYDERLVFHREKLEPNGYVNLEGRLTRPFSLAYHDVYLDGFRLTKFDIEQISPYSFVVLKASKIKSISCLEIYEKTHAMDEYVKFEFDEASEYIMDKLVSRKFSPEEYTQLMLDAINETYPIIPEVDGITHIDDQFNGWGDFIKYYIIFDYLNADLRHDYGRWKHVFDEEDGRILLNADDRVRYIRYVQTMFYFNHDLTLEGQTVPNPEYEYDGVVYPYDPSISMREEDYVANGFFTRKYNPVFDEDFEIVPKEDLEPTTGYADAVKDKDIYIPDMDYHHVDSVERDILSDEEIQVMRDLDNPEVDLRMDMVIHFENGETWDLWDQVHTKTDGTTESFAIEDEVYLVYRFEQTTHADLTFRLNDKYYDLSNDLLYNDGEWEFFNSDNPEETFGFGDINQTAQRTYDIALDNSLYDPSFTLVEDSYFIADNEAEFDENDTKIELFDEPDIITTEYNITHYIDYIGSVIEYNVDTSFTYANDSFINANEGGVIVLADSEISTLDESGNVQTYTLGATEFNGDSELKDLLDQTIEMLNTSIHVGDDELEYGEDAMVYEITKIDTTGDSYVDINGKPVGIEDFAIKADGRTYALVPSDEYYFTPMDYSDDSQLVLSNGTILSLFDTAIDGVDLGTPDITTEVGTVEVLEQPIVLPLIVLSQEYDFFSNIRLRNSKTGRIDFLNYDIQANGTLEIHGYNKDLPIKTPDEVGLDETKLEPMDLRDTRIYVTNDVHDLEDFDTKVDKDHWIEVSDIFAKYA